MANSVLRRADRGLNEHSLAASKTESRKTITLPTREWQEKFDAKLRAEDRTRVEPVT